MTTQIEAGIETETATEAKIERQQANSALQQGETAQRTIPARAAAGRIHIERLILHGLDNRMERIQLVDEPALLTEESELFFAHHVEAALSRADWRAHFTDPKGEVARLCQQLLGETDEFVGASKLLARRLYAQMRPRTIAPGDFVALVYSVGDDLTRHVALLKLDPDQRLIRTFSRSGGHYRVSITTAGNLLPDTARLQKCALLTVPAPDAGFDVTLLDTQAGPRAASVATFFYRGFLTTELSPSPRRHTREFLRCCDTWIGLHHDHLTPATLIAFYQARREALRADMLDCASFVSAALPEHPELADELALHLARTYGTTESDELLVTPTFAVDRSIAGQVVSRVTLELDGGARLTIPSDRFAELVRIEPSRTAENKIRIVIESLMLREVGDR